MLPVLTVPAGLGEVLQVVGGAFAAPTFATFVALVTGYLGATGRRTVTGMWIAAGLAGVAHHARAHRFFSHAAYRSPGWRSLPAAVTCTTRLPANAVLYAPAPPRTGRRGRPRPKGARLGTAADLAAAAAWRTT